MYHLSSRSIYGGLAIVTISALVVLASGCATQTNGMTLPSGHYQRNRVQYFPKGTEFPFSKEAAQLEEARAERQ